MNVFIDTCALGSLRELKYSAEVALGTVEVMNYGLFIWSCYPR